MARARWSRWAAITALGATASFGCGESSSGDGTDDPSRNQGGSSGSAMGGSSGTSAGSSGTSAGSSGTSAGSSGTSAGSSAGGSGGGSDGTTPEGFRSAFIRAACQNLFECDWGSDAFAMRFLLQTEERCLETYDSNFGPFIQSRVDAVARGTLTFDPEEARRCLEVVPRSCVLWESEEPLDAFRDTCSEVFEGTVPEGGDCASDEDCVEDSFCNRIDEPLCLGRCVRKLAPGSACDGTVACSRAGGVEATCQDDLTCASVTLGASAAEGETCGHVPSGEHAFTLVPCDVGTFCDRDSETRMGTCAPPIPVGGECSSENPPCLEGGLCVDDPDLTRCVVFTLQTSPGAPCRNSEREVCDPLSGLVCTAEVCEPSGGECVSGFGCTGAEYCETDQCLPRLADGEECTFDGQCANSLCVQRLPNEPHRCYSAFCSEW